jgi:hypothetical protein
LISGFDSSICTSFSEYGKKVLEDSFAKKSSFTKLVNLEGFLKVVLQNW